MKLKKHIFVIVALICLISFASNANAMVQKYIGNNEVDFEAQANEANYGSGDTFTGADNMKSGAITICGKSYSTGGNISSTKIHESGLIKLSIKKLDLDKLTAQFGQNIGTWIYQQLSNASVISSSSGSYRYIHLSSKQTPCGENIELTTSDVSAPKFVKAVYDIKPQKFYDAGVDQNGKVTNVDVGMDYKQAVCLAPNPEKPFTAKQKTYFKNEVITNTEHKFEINDKNKISTSYAYRCAGVYNVTITLYDSQGNTQVKKYTNVVDALMIQKDPEYQDNPKKGGLVIRE